ncbi:MAG: hypothetical protein QM820_31760 [Minicystis sp.]
MPAAAQPAKTAAQPAQAATPAEQRDDAEVARRLAFIQGRLDRGERSAKIWWHAWYTGYLTLAVGQGVIAVAVKSKETRADMAVGAVESALGAGALGVFDFPARYAGSAVHALPEGTPEERRHKLAVAETLLRKSAEGEAFGRSWIAHAACAAVAAGSGLLLGFGYKRGWAALTNVIGSIAISEVQIWTQPTAAIGDWKDYQAGAFGGAARPAQKAPGAWWQVSVLPGGVGVVGAF